MKKLLELMKNLPENLDAAVITDNTNRRYYTQVKSSAGTVVVTREQSYLIIDSRYHEMALKQSVDCQVVLQDNLKNQITELLKKHSAKNVGIEYRTISVSVAEQLCNWLEGFNVVKDNTLGSAIDHQRAIKSSTEQDYIQTSQNVTDKTFQYALSVIKPGMTELELALEMEFYSRKNGSEEAPFSFIVASGANSSKPHAVPGNTPIASGTFLLMDFGSTYNGYRSDMTRTVAVGEVSDKHKEVYETVLNAQLKAMKDIKAGAVCGDIHNIALDYIDSTPYKGKFNHGLGHGLGMDVHEDPSFNPRTEKAIAKTNMVFSVEPGIYLPGEFGVRTEDLICVTDNGFRNFTASPKELIVL